LVQVAVVEGFPIHLHLISMPKGYLLALVVQVHLVTTAVVREDMAVVVVLWAVVVDTMAVVVVIYLEIPALVAVDTVHQSFKTAVA
jgi:hypothetical protein